MTREQGLCGMNKQHHSCTEYGLQHAQQAVGASIRVAFVVPLSASAGGGTDDVAECESHQQLCPPPPEGLHD